jgi:IclR family acetate operon transcriptional repressor
MAARNYIELVDKTMRVLQTLAAAKSPMLLKDLAAQTGIVKSSVFRILFTLKELGYVEQAVRNGDYRLSLMMLPLARGTPRATLANVARPHLRRVCLELGESVWLAQRRGEAIVIVDCVLAPHRLKLSYDVGDLCPIHATAIGKCVTAFMKSEEAERVLQSARLEPFTSRTITQVSELRKELERVRQSGYAINDEETVDGVILIGSPIFDTSRQVCGAVSVSALADRSSPARRKAIIEAAKRCAGAVSDDLHGLAHAFTF